MNFLKEEIENAEKALKVKDRICGFCGSKGLEVVPFPYDSVQRMGSVISPSAVIVRLLMTMCPKCDNMQFFRGSVVDKKPEGAADNTENKDVENNDVQE